MTPANSPELVNSDAVIENRRPMKVGRFTLPPQRIVVIEQNNRTHATVVRTEYGTIRGSFPLTDFRFVGPPDQCP